MHGSRRNFFRSSLAASSLVSMGGATVPTFLARSALAASHPAAKSGGDRVLVVIQLIGGNDGLNTVIPHAMDGYAKGRKALRIKSDEVKTITSEIGLHPAMGGFAGLIEGGHAAIIQGVGYPNPDRSHFRSMEIWEGATTAAGKPETGWLGRALDSAPRGSGGDMPGLHLGGHGLPLALRARDATVPSLETLDQFRLRIEGADADRRASRDALDSLTRLDRGPDDALLGFLRRSTLAAFDASRRLEAVVAPKDGGASYPNYGLARRLELIARIIKAGFGTRIYYTSLDGFDTHANQAAPHRALLTELSASLAAFHADLAADGQADRVATLAFSEFGRRVEENASGGTDHGAAAPVFVVGPLAKTGLVGEHPSFDKLDDGDLRFKTDFRRVYADLLGPWLGIPAAPIVGDGHEPVGLFGPEGT
ncbi:DUF1501 domain-containing protein [Isosphaeraceae bacterium EP7]